MPNHIPAIIVIDGRPQYSLDSPVAMAVSCVSRDGAVPTNGVSLSTIVGGKAGASRTSHLLGLKNFHWRSLFHEHILRSEASVNAVRDYIDHNPENWMQDPDNPFSLPAAGDGASPVSTKKSADPICPSR